MNGAVKHLKGTIEILESRGSEYGPGNDEMERVAMAFNAITDSNLKPRHIALIYMLTKLRRNEVTTKPDNAVDNTGYSALYAWCEDGQDV